MDLLQGHGFFVYSERTRVSVVDTPAKEGGWNEKSLLLEFRWILRDASVIAHLYTHKTDDVYLTEPRELPIALGLDAVGQAFWQGRGKMTTLS